MIKCYTCLNNLWFALLTCTYVGKWQGIQCDDQHVLHCSLGGAKAGDQQHLWTTCLDANWFTIPESFMGS